jgi:hypothetical protein
MTNNVELLMDDLVLYAKLKERHIDTAKFSVEMAASCRMGGRRQQAAHYLHVAEVHRKHAEEHARSLATARNMLLEACYD